MKKLKTFTVGDGEQLYVRLPLSDLCDNPFRHVDRCPINEPHVNELVESIDETGLWGNSFQVVIRDGKLHVVTHHHLLRAAKKYFGGQYVITAELVDYNDWQLLRVLHNENSLQHVNPQAHNQNMVRNLLDYWESEGGAFDKYRTWAHFVKCSENDSDPNLPTISQMREYFSGNSGSDDKAVASNYNKLHLGKDVIHRMLGGGNKPSLRDVRSALADINSSGYKRRKNRHEDAAVGNAVINVVTGVDSEDRSVSYDVRASQEFEKTSHANAIRQFICTHPDYFEMDVVEETGEPDPENSTMQIEFAKGVKEYIENAFSIGNKPGEVTTDRITRCADLLLDKFKDHVEDWNKCEEEAITEEEQEPVPEIQKAIEKILKEAELCEKSIKTIHSRVITIRETMDKFDITYIERPIYYLYLESLSDLYKELTTVFMEGKRAKNVISSVDQYLISHKEEN